ncbi:protein AGENET DOMAIN (AGD)-CONTAINING P1-like [Bidens hawaiensis]|uniref:protein AGENET DOMAIN (AGD)-CONTAINING P1-like n=1 Tax=Bidens hawaiensis TaxID=980011 RepID=UPI00404AF634
MKSKRGDSIEVVDMGSGFVGSFYDGNIVSRVGKKTYIVQFSALLEDDQSSEFVLGQKVDVFANDGWWAGRIASKIGETKYLVHFDSTNQDIIYLFANIRVHQVWDAANDVWVYTCD